jgi:hypothetical protein
MSPRLRGGLAVALLVAATLAGHPATAATLPNPCRDGAYTLTQSVWKTAYDWRFVARSTPPGVSTDAAAAALQRAARNITTGRNSCGFADDIGAEEQFMGTTSASMNITGSGSCGQPDGQSEVGFGSLSNGALGVTCYWIRNGQTVEADIMLNKAGYRWVADPGPSCLAAWSIEAVATHEFGHAFGLGHVSERLHGLLTMSPSIKPCQLGETTLGLGDIRGLRAKY